MSGNKSKVVEEYEIRTTFQKLLDLGGVGSQASPLRSVLHLRRMLDPLLFLCKSILLSELN